MLESHSLDVDRIRNLTIFTYAISCCCIDTIPHNWVCYHRCDRSEWVMSRVCRIISKHRMYGFVSNLSLSLCGIELCTSMDMRSRVMAPPGGKIEYAVNRCLNKSSWVLYACISDCTVNMRLIVSIV